MRPLAMMRALKALADAVDDGPRTFDLRHPDGTVETRTFASLRSSGRPPKVRRSNRADLAHPLVIEATRQTRGYQKATHAVRSARAARAAERARRRAAKAVA